jgi:hypothetical protein
MSAKKRQQTIISALMESAPVNLKVDRVFQVGDERPDNHIYSLACECGGFVRINLDQDKDGEWASYAQEKLDQHLAQSHKGES